MTAKKFFSSFLINALVMFTITVVKLLWTGEIGGMTPNPVALFNSFTSIVGWALVEPTYLLIKEEFNKNK